MSRGCFINAWRNKMPVSPFIFLNRSHGWHLTHYAPSLGHFILISKGSRENRYLACLSNRSKPIGLMGWSSCAVAVELFEHGSRSVKLRGGAHEHNESATWHTLLSFLTVWGLLLLAMLFFFFSVELGGKLAHSTHVHLLLSSSHLGFILLYFRQSYIKLPHHLQLLCGAERVEISWGCVLGSELSRLEVHRFDWHHHSWKRLWLKRLT